MFVNEGSADVGAYKSRPVPNQHSLFRSCSQNVFEENSELSVSDDGLIVSTLLDDHTTNERLMILLDKKDKEMRQAAEYGLSLLESNEELELQVASLKIQLESNVAELTAERELYKRRYENGLCDIENWKKKLKRIEEEKYELCIEIEKVMARATISSDSHILGTSNDNLSSNVNRVLQLRISELEHALLEIKLNEENNVIMIQALTDWKISMEKEQQNTNIEHAYANKLEAQQAELREQLDHLQQELEHSRHLVLKKDSTIAQLKLELVQLQEQFALQQIENREQSDLRQTMEAKCTRLQRELSLMEHVSYLSLAVIDHDKEDEEGEDVEVHKSQQPEKHEYEPTRRRSSIAHSFFPISIDNQTNCTTSSTPSAVPIHQKLYHYFHLTAVSIIHENDLQEVIFTSSSRHTIDQWYQEVLSAKIPYLEWHAWLIQRIRVIATSCRESTISSTTSSKTRRLLPTSRVSFSVAKTFFRLLRRQENQTE